jgi:hypothetical protein
MTNSLAALSGAERLLFTETRPETSRTYSAAVRRERSIYALLTFGATAFIFCKMCMSGDMAKIMKKTEKESIHNPFLRHKKVFLLEYFHHYIFINYQLNYICKNALDIISDI